VSCAYKIIHVIVHEWNMHLLHAMYYIVYAVSNLCHIFMSIIFQVTALCHTISGGLMTH
jgi:hypothetical protein